MLAYVLSKIFGKLSPYSVRLNAYGHIIRIDMFAASRFNRLIWSIIEFISILPLVLLQVYLPLRLGVVIICERFLVDSVVSIAYALNDPNFDSSFIAKIMLHLIPKNSILIHLDSSYDAVKHRRGSLTDPEDFFDFQREMYKRLSRCLNAVKIDTVENGIAETALKINKVVLQRLKHV